jgi:hypothetical protein
MKQMSAISYEAKINSKNLDQFFSAEEKEFDDEEE